ncbi:MAG: excinuclease ABC subunit C [Deltaproteobacteria bacterium]|nr:excinuclease ABC subunit C [Deltaproteobacteria bacterium]
MPRLPFDKSSVASIPASPGVYVFLDDRGKPVYVGKAVDLRSRVRSYFGAGDARLVSALIQEKAHALDFIVTGSAKEALILENSLIKKHGPLLNIRLKDDATYFSLRLDLKEPWPRLTIVRKRKKEDVLYFGPYPSAHACRKTIQFLNRVFPMRTCPDSQLYNRSRPCISYEIGQCNAPCVGLVERTRYLKVVDRVVRFLSGRDQEVLKELEKDMLVAAERLEFERAADLRDRLQHMRTTLQSPQVARRGGPDRDIIGLADVGDEVALCVLHVRDGQLAASAQYTFKRWMESDELLASFLGQFYGPERQPPAEILMPRECADLELHREILEQAREAGVALRVPERGEGLRLLKLAERNAELGHRRTKEEDERAQDSLHALQARLDLFQFPERMECFDISHLGGEQVVGSRVSFLAGRPDKDHYRHYRLREVQRNDDFAAMEEVLRRRLKRGVKEDDLPELIVIDGGRAQLARVVGVLRVLEIATVDVVGLAKARSVTRARTTEQAHERVYLPDREVPIVLEKDAPETLLLQRLRDEAHRFAITYSRRLRGKEKIGTVLEMVPGIGHRKARALLEHFGSLSGVKAATAAQLAEADGITLALADAVLAFFREHADG